MRGLLVVFAVVIALPAFGCRQPSSAIADDAAATPIIAVTSTTSPPATASTATSASATASATAVTAVTAVTAAHAPASADASTKTSKKALPKCAAGQGLFAVDEDGPPFCAKSCGTDAECKPAKCDGTYGFMVDEQTGRVFTGVGKSVPLCGAVSTTAPKTSR